MNTPVSFNSNLAPFSSPQYLRGGSQTLPSNVNAPDSSVSALLPSSTLDLHRYAYVTSLSTTLANANTGIKFLDMQDTKRNFLVLRNASITANLYVDFALQASTNSWLMLSPGQTILFDTVVPQDDLYFFTDAANGVLRYGYSTLGIR